MRIDLNADVGEAATPVEELVELALTGIVSSINIACGAHAGDRAAMRRMLALAAARGLGAGAHPGYADREGRGRRAVTLPPDEVYALVRGQILELGELALEHGLRLSHVKPHGALYNQAAVDREPADAIAAAVRDIDPELRLIGPYGSRLLDAGVAAGLAVRAEAFVDRAYRPDGTLVPRSEPDALITRPDAAVAQALRFVLSGSVRAVDGAELRLRPHTLCIHSDTPGAVFLARRVRAALVERGVEIATDPVRSAPSSNPSA